MPKPILPAKLTADMPVGAAAALLLEAKLTEVRRSAGAALTGDFDGIHDLRIAVKRLRETMRLFRPLFPKRRGRELLAPVERLNDSLGAVRDRDVLAAYVEDLRGQAPEAGSLLTGLHDGWLTEREALFGEFAALWERLSEAEGIDRRLAELAKATRRRQRPANRVPLDRFAYAAVTGRLERVSLHLRETGDQSDPPVLHRLRILVKRLKYGMEPFLPALPALEGLYPPVADLQESLGLVHDLDVLRAAVLDYARRRHLGSRPVLEPLLTRRQETFETASAQLQILRSTAWQRSVLDSLD